MPLKANCQNCLSLQGSLNCFITLVPWLSDWMDSSSPGILLCCSTAFSVSLSVKLAEKCYSIKTQCTSFINVIAGHRAVKWKPTLCSKAFRERSKMVTFFFLNLHTLKLEDPVKGRTCTVLQKLRLRILHLNCLDFWLLLKWEVEQVFFKHRTIWYIVCGYENM